MEYIEIKNNIITGHYCGDLPNYENSDIQCIIIKNQCNVNIGDNINIYTDIQKGIKKPLKQLVKESLISIPKDKKLNDDGTKFIDLTDAEMVERGLIVLKPTEKISGDYIIEKNEEEKYKDGLITAEEYNEYIIKMRENAYLKEADPLGMQVLRGDIEKKEWLDKIEEIKKRFPKVEV